MSDDGPTDDSIVATTFRGIIANGAPCLLEMLVMNFTRLMTHFLGMFIHLLVMVYLDDILFLL
jgi:hypothetical protein